MVGEALAGLSAFKTAFDIAKGLKDISDASLRNAAVIELQEKILSAQAAQSTLIEHVRELEGEVARLKAWDAEEKNYDLTSVGDGVFAYVKKPVVEGGEHPHYLCANCFDQRQKSILHKEVTDVGRWTVLHCNRCNANYYPDGGGREFGGKRR